MDKRKRRDILYYGLMAVLAVIFLGSGGMLLKNYLRDRQHETEFEAITSLFPEAGTLPAAAAEPADVKAESAGAETAAAKTEPEAIQIPPAEWKAWWEDQAAGRFSTYRDLMGQNGDMVGWVRIEGTRLDYPVMQTPDRPDYYLHRDFEQKYSNYGIPYMDGVCSTAEPRTSLLIYGHHMRNGAMFAALQNYTEESYFRQHPYIQFDTADQAGSYEIAAVVKIDAASDSLPWRGLLFAENEEQFAAARKAFEKQEFYSTGVPLSYGDRLLALVTCEYTLKDGRLMVVAREILSDK